MQLTLETILKYVNACDLCVSKAANKSEPILHISKESQIIIINESPPENRQQNGLPWSDEEAETLRGWLNVSEAQFYNSEIFGHLPLNLCYLEKNKPETEANEQVCRSLWHKLIMDFFKDVKFTILVGSSSHKHYLNGRVKENLGANIKSFREFLPEFFVLPSPKIGNSDWIQDNKWFEDEVIPELRKRIDSALASKVQAN